MKKTKKTKKLSSSCEGLVKANYYYFGFLFFILAFIHVLHILIVDHGSFNAKCFFIVYAIAQCFLEIIGLVMIAGVITAYLPKLLTPVFIVFTFLLFLSQLVDFPLIRLMDMSIWYVLGFLPQESPKNFMEMLYASNVSISAWITGGIVALIFIAAGVVFFKYTEKKALSKPFALSYRLLSLALCGGFICLLGWDAWGAHINGIQKDYAHEKTLPWKATFFSKGYETFALGTSLKSLHVTKESSSFLPPLRKKPPIFLFVAESLREDYMTKEVAPNLYHFKQENITFDLALSNANATQMSWFSIFHSKLPFYWSIERVKEKKEGSLPLQRLKKLGYKIHVLSSSCLNYYQMDELIFANDTKLVESFRYFHHDEETPTYKCDAKLINDLGEQISKAETLDGNVFVIFLESTHFGYSWPKQKSPFKPYVESINYLKATVSKEDIYKIQNSYKNAIHYTDFLFGRFRQKLEEKKLWRDSIVIFTGDHGEEFYEEGHLFHISNLSKCQTHVPLYYKLGKSEILKSKVQGNMTSHVDIFPTILHFLAPRDFDPELYDGTSILMKREFPYIVSARYNASRTPYEFSIHNGKYKMIARFSNERDIFNSKELKILSLVSDKDEEIEYSIEDIQVEFKDALYRLFPSS